MVRNTSTTRDADGWSLRFKNNKADTTIPIQNPFHKEVEKIATSFYVTNFLDYVDAKRLWKECESYGRIVDTFIINKKSRVGKRFGFVRFIGVKNEEELANSLATIWIGSYHLFATVARFKRKETYAELPKKPVENNSSYIPDNKVTLSDHELVQMNNSLEIALVKVKSVETMSTLYRLCCKEGFDEVKIHHIKGLWLWLQFQNEETCNAFKKNNNLKSFFSLIKLVSKNFSVDERMVWVEISGLRLCAWGSNAYKKVASTVGKFMFFENDNSASMSLGRVCVATKQKSLISEGVQVTIHGEDYTAQVQELGSWSINIEDSTSQESDSQKGDEGDKERDSKSEDDIDEDQQVDKQDNKEQEKEQEKHQVESIHSHTGNKAKTPPIETDNNKRSVTSDWSRPPGFEHFNKTDNEPSESSLQSKLYKCTAPFDRYSQKDIRGILVIHELSKLIEVGEKLWLLEFIRNHDGHFVIFGDLNKVRDENVKVTALPRGWSDHIPIMLHCEKVDYGPVSFKLFHSWLQRDGFDDCIKMAYNECSINYPHMPFHEKLKSRRSKKRIRKLLKERDDLQQLEDMDVVQKSKVKWDVEGDENTKKFMKF
ncbi:RNA-directed DNA polymerase, eukaryota [Tanacetum coccineum]